MGYATYEFYKTKYFGDIMDEESFSKWMELAGRQLDSYTDRRLQSAFPEDEYTREQVALCVCELAEKMLETDRYLKASAITENGTSGMVKSISAGSESITYATGETVYAGVLKDQNSLNSFYYAVVTKYLTGLTDADGIHLLYAGW